MLKVNEIFKRLSEQNPNPTTDLDYTNPYTLLVAVVLSAQTTDAGVNKATKSLFSKVSTPQDMIKLGKEELINHIKTIGLFRAKAENVMKLSQTLIDKYNGEVPNTREKLEELAGVGRKTANVVLSVVYNQPTIAVDTHVFRLANRLDIGKGKNPLEVELALLDNIPKKYLKNAHHWLILHGRYTCKAKKPDCKACIISDLCSSDDKLI